MTEAEWKYYLGQGPEVEKILEAANKAKEDLRNARHALMEEYQANGVLPGDKLGYTIAGLLYYEKPSFEFMKYAQAEGTTKDGRTYFIARPFLRQAKGKELAEKLAAPEVTFNAQHELINLLGMDCMASVKGDSPQSGQQVIWSKADQAGSMVLVKIPANVRRQSILGKSPRIPKFLKLIKKDKYDALLAGDLSVLEK
ncbi:MAG: hypothetical protein Q3990_01005 [Desulfovibrionaceae bacterium]|nr:hypothetical protein [Desulfovibrionaceae bacterium]